MKIDDAEEALVLVLQLHPIAQCSQIIAEMQGASGFNSAEDPFHD
jgi:hypothetical protein